MSVDKDLSHAVFLINTIPPIKFVQKNLSYFRLMVRMI